LKHEVTEPEEAPVSWPILSTLNQLSSSN